MLVDTMKYYKACMTFFLYVIPQRPRSLTSSKPLEWWHFYENK